jgi:hypothetical protein
MAMSCKGKTALLDRLQNRTHRERGGAADQSTHGRIGLRTACEAETSRMKNVSIEKSGRKNYFLRLKETVFTETIF